MMKLRILCLPFLMFGLSHSFAVAEEHAAPEEKVLTKAEKRLAKFKNKYQATGKVRKCVPLHALRNSNVINDQMIIFRMGSKKAYVNNLPRKCSRLAIEDRFSYTVSIGQLCNTEVITVLDSFGHAWNRCRLGKFEEWEKKPSDAAKELSSALK